jgi:hypothetical protein
MSCAKSQLQWCHGVVSLLRMMQLFADIFIKHVSALCSWEERCSWNPKAEVTSGQITEIYAFMQMVIGQLAPLGFNSAVQKSERISERLRNQVLPITYGEMQSLLRELRERVEDEFSHRMIFCLSLGESELYKEPLKEWQEVSSRFGKIRFDIEECSRCFALGRYGAAIFHALLVAEFGVIKIAELVNVQGDRPGWGSLDRIERILKKKWNERTPLEQQHSQFLEGVMPFALRMKDSWRHKLNHVDNKIVWFDTTFSPDLAKEILSAIRGFMSQLSRALPNGVKQ